MKRRIYRVAARADTTRLNPPILDTLEVDLKRGDDCSEVIKHISSLPTFYHIWSTKDDESLDKWMAATQR